MEGSRREGAGGPTTLLTSLRGGAAKGLGIKGLRKRVEGSRREGTGERWKRGLKGEAEGLD